jgi:hypothetical protein
MEPPQGKKVGGCSRREQIKKFYSCLENEVQAKTHHNRSLSNSENCLRQRPERAPDFVSPLFGKTVWEVVNATILSPTVAS